VTGGSTKRSHGGAPVLSCPDRGPQGKYRFSINHLQDHDRCSESMFFNDSASLHADMALGCLKPSKLNPCNLLGFSMNRDVIYLPELLGDEDTVCMPLLDRIHSGIPNHRRQFHSTDQSYDRVLYGLRSCAWKTNWRARFITFTYSEIRNEVRSCV
jgi:hypothetical protein